MPTPKSELRRKAVGRPELLVERVSQLEAALDDVVSAFDLPGDHSEAAREAFLKEER